VRIEADRLYGRGAVDAKGSLATFVCAAAAARLPSGVRVRVIGAVEEEAATSAGARFAARTWRPDACIIGEPSGADAVTLGYKGRLIATARLATPCSHSAGPEPTAPELAAVVWQRLLAQASALRPDATRVFDQVQARLRSIRSASDGMRDRAEFTLGFRIPPGVLPGSIESLCHASTRELPCECEWAFSGPEVAHVADRTNPVVRALAASIRAQGSNPGYKLKTGTSDMNVVGPIWNCPIAAYGPGDSSLDHTPDEHIVLPEYLRAIRILTHALETLGAELAGAGPADQS
jgi:LysW-gamma-L-lysine carboxypeptidase